jgi:beta-N-acetylhexosaminidase
MRPSTLRRATLGILVLSESVLLLISLVPQTTWASLGYPDGPIPEALVPLVAGLFYLLPTLTGVLCRRWSAAITLATLPAWLDLGLFAIVAAPRLGPFSFAQDPHAAALVGTLELFIVLGLLGWIARVALRDDLERRWRRLLLRTPPAATGPRTPSPAGAATPAERREDDAEEPTRVPPASSPLARHGRETLLFCFLLIIIHSGVASDMLMAPGGAIHGWSRLPQVHCTLCPVRVESATPHHPLPPLTPTHYAALLAPHLSLDEQLGQLLLVQFAGSAATPDTVQMINTQGVGGVISYALNIQSPDQVRAMTTALQRMAPIPLLMAVDQEGGVVNRFRSIVGPLPSAASLATPEMARTRGEQDALLLHTYGYNLNLAPVVDVGSANPELATRTFGTDSLRVAAMAGAYLTGLQASGTVTACLKHFPGLGATTTNPHFGLPILTRSRAEWEAIDLAPYRLLLSTQDVRAIMVTHELIPAVDAQYPSSLSPIMIDEALRRELGFQGVVITDSLYMGALNRQWSVPQAAVLAIAAGADMIMGISNPQMVAQIKAAVKSALASGVLTTERIAGAVRRILALKIALGLIPFPRTATATATDNRTA